jgi:hypothetical protein
MNFLKRWMLKKIRTELYNLDRLENTPVEASISMNKYSETDLQMSERAIKFTVYPANGGRVVETSKFDLKTERSKPGLYIITNEQDFGKEIDKIITMELLKS